MCRKRPALLASIAITLTLGCVERPQPAVPFSTRLDDALTRGVEFLASRQDADGLWRSEVYGSSKDQSALTPLVAWRYAANRQGNERAVSFLAGMVRPDGAIDTQSRGVPYPLYTAALTVNLLVPRIIRLYQSERGWAADLAKRQLDENLGGKRLEIGGWGYAKELPRKPGAGSECFPEPSRTFSRQHLLSKHFAWLASRMTFFARLVCLGDRHDWLPQSRLHVPREAFLTRTVRSTFFCRSPYRTLPELSEAPVQASPFDDGGFFFIPNDSVRNKAGITGKDTTGRDRYASYGSARQGGSALFVPVACRKRKQACRPRGVGSKNHFGPMLIQAAMQATAR